MTTKPSAAPWADGPFKLITTASQTHDINTHSSLWAANEMALVHNCLIRGLNAIILQAPHIPPSTSPTYCEQDVKDLLYYVLSWTKIIDQHHHTEETVLFPDIEKFAGKPGLMQHPTDQHHGFTPGLHKLQAYVQNTAPEKYRWEGDGGMKAIIDDFAPSMMQHLYDEIDTFLSLSWMDSKGLRECCNTAKKAAKAAGGLDMLYEVFPCVLGTSDKTFEGGNSFLQFPFYMPYAIKYWFAASHSGAWRFNPCDFWGRPVPLHFLPRDQMKQ